MPHIDLASVAVAVTVGGSATTVNFPPVSPADMVTFTSPPITATANAQLVGTAGEAAGGWTFGFIQLEYIETLYARYRGRTQSEGGVLVTRGGQLSRTNALCRDTDPAHPTLWYQRPGVPTRGGSTMLTPSAATLPVTRSMALSATLIDHPSDGFDFKEQNPSAHNADCFLHSVEIAFHFCSILAAQEPARGAAPGALHLLKHFYWNARWFVHFAPDASGRPTITRQQNMEVNAQRPVRSGVPDDSRFKDRVRDMTLPACATLATAPLHKRPSRTWEDAH